MRRISWPRTTGWPPFPNPRALFKEKGILVLNLVFPRFRQDHPIGTHPTRPVRQVSLCAVIEGDQQTDNDARRIAATGVPDTVGSILVPAAIWMPIW